jgi:cytochrome c biogenesis protein CcdA
MNFVKLIPPELKLGNMTAPQLKMREVSFSPTLFITKSNSSNSSYKAIMLFFAGFLLVLSLLGLGLIDMGSRIPLTFWAGIVMIGLMIREGIK